MDAKFNEIQQTILDAVAAESDLSALQILTAQEQQISSADNTSVASLWRRLVWIFAYAMWLHEKIVSRNAENSRPQNLPNFRAAILNFHDGLDLVWKDGAFSYDLTGVVDAEARKIIDRCAGLESDDGELVVKIATDNAGVLQPIGAAEELRLKAYIRQIKVPGVRIRLVNQIADDLMATITVYVNPLIIDLATGQLLNTSATVFPVKDAIQTYLTKLEFNGALVKDRLRSEIRNADGIELAVIDDLQWKFDAFPFAPVGEWQIPEAGYFTLADANLTINYQPYVLVNG